MKLVKESLLDKEDNAIKYYFAGDLKIEFLIVIVDGKETIGGLYAGKPNTGESQFNVMKVAVKTKGYGTKLYLMALALLGNKGLSAHRTEWHTTKAAIKVWKKLSEYPFIKKEKLKSLYKDKELSKYLDYKYIMTKEKRQEILKNNKVIDSGIKDPFQKNIKEPFKTAWEIINKNM